jgi:hypothetical protein
MSGGIAHYDGRSWTSTPGPSLWALWGFSRSDIFAIGSGNVMYHYDGTQWATVPGSEAIGCARLWGTSAQNLWCLSRGHELAHYDGVAWTTTPIPLYGFGDYMMKWAMNVWGTSASNIIVSGSYGRVMGYDGSGWTMYAQGGGPDDPLSAIGGVGTDIFAMGLYRGALHGH